MGIQIGKKYEKTRDLDIKEIAKLVRQDIKRERPDLKTSVTIERYANGQSLNISVVESPNLLWHGFGYSPFGTKVHADLRKIGELYNKEEWEDNGGDGRWNRYHLRVSFLRDAGFQS